MTHRALFLASLSALGLSTLALPCATLAGVCAKSQVVMPAGPPGAGPPRIVTAASTVIRPDVSKQISCGKVVLETIADVTYAQVPGGRALKLDILKPKAAPGPLPLVVFVTGGGFVADPKQSELNLRTYLAEQGFVVASIQYRVFPDHATYRDGVADVKSAVRFLRAHAGEYGVDPAWVGLWGESAGGYLVSMAGLTGNSDAFNNDLEPTQSSAVSAVVDAFGAADVSKLAQDFDPAAQAAYAHPMPTNLYVGGLTPDGQLADPASNPVKYVSASAPPFLLLHGSDDRVVSPSQTLAVHEALRAAGAKSTRYVIEGANHGDLGFLGDDKASLPWSTVQTMELIVAFFRDNLQAAR
jgi:acetyl esterase/lipase